MNKFTVIGTCGQGSAGSVMRAKRWATGEEVAIKKLSRQRFKHGFDEVLMLREVQALRQLRHPNIIALKELIRELDAVLIIFEYMPISLHQWIKARILGKIGYPSEGTVASIGQHVLLALNYMHRRDFVHRDIKPMNILTSEDASIVKVTDLGSTRVIQRIGRASGRGQPGKPQELTHYVSTRWYRAPELLLRAPSYGPAVDIWAVGCTLAEVRAMQPMFPGSSEIDQLHRITAVLGTPTDGKGSINAWSDRLKLMRQWQRHQQQQQAAAANADIPTSAASSLVQVVPPASQQMLELLGSMLRWDPAKRLSAAQCMRHRFFSGLPATISSRWRAALGRWAQRATRRTILVRGPAAPP